MKLKWIFYFSWIILVLYTGISIFWIAQHPKETPFGLSASLETPVVQSSIPKLAPSITADNLVERFPYVEFLGAQPFKQYATLQLHISVLDSLFPTADIPGQQVMAKALTEKLFEQKKALMNGYQPDSLLQVLEWAEQFKVYAETAPQNALAYHAIHDYWLAAIALVLAEAEEQDSKIKATFKFRFMAEKCGRNLFYVNIKETQIEKFKKNLLAGNWVHLLNASWHDSSITQKVAFFSLILLTSIAYFQLVISILSFFKKSTR